jgi:feruloyl esterase
METWLPKNWTGRFLSTGNVGLGGCTHFFNLASQLPISTHLLGIQYVDLAYTTAQGFATVGANDGQNDTNGALFLNNDEVLADFVYRS